MENTSIIIGRVVIILIVVAGFLKFNHYKKTVRIKDDELKNIETSDEIIFTDIKNTTVSKIYGCIILIGIASTYLYSIASDDGTYLLITILISLIYIFFSSRYTNKSFKDFAAENRFYYQKEGMVNDASGPIFNLGCPTNFENIIGLKIKNHKTLFFHYEYETGSGKNKSSHYFTILEIKFDATFPRILLNPKKSLLETNITNEFEGVLDPIEINLDGELCDTHELITEKNFQLEALQIFTPDMIGGLADYEYLRLDLDNNNVNIIREYAIDNRTDFEKMFKLADYLIEKIDPIKDAVSKSTKELKDITTKNYLK